MEILNRKKAVAAMLGGLAAAYLFCVPTGAVRLSLAMYGHPMQAVAGQLEGGFVHSWIAEEDQPPFPVRLQAFHVGQPVTDWQTGNLMENWAVYRIGPFCVAKHWGYC